MKRLFLLASIAAAIASAQTEVHKAPPPFPNWETLKFPPLPSLKIPTPEEFTLPNGMRVYLLEDHELPVINGIALVRTGNLFDPQGKVGLAGVTGDAIRSGGTRKMTGDQIDTALENVAASVESEIGESSGSLSFNCLKENTDTTLSLFHDVLTQPEFREDKIDLLKKQLHSGISRRNDDPSGIASREFTNIVYGRQTPYGWMMEHADVDNIQRADVIAFYKRYYFPSNILLGIYGDFNAAQMRERLTRLFSDWTYTQPPVPKFPPVEKKPEPGIYLAVKTDVNQTFFDVGHLGGVLSDKDYPALAVASDILGSGFSSRLFRRVRTKLGYAYNIYGQWGANYDHPGLFEISGSTQSQYTVQTLEAIREEIERMRTTQVSDEELKVAKDTVENSFVFLFDRPSKTLRRVLTYAYFDYPKDFVFRFQKGVQAVSKADVQRVAGDYFAPKELTYVAVGNPPDFQKPLSELGLPVQPIDLTIPEPPKETAKATSESLEQGRSLLAEAQKAMGGADKLAGVKDVRMHAKANIQSPGGAMAIDENTTFIAPRAMRQELVLPFGKMIVYSDGHTGWMSTPRGVTPIPPPVLEQANGETFRDLPTLVLSGRDPDRTVNLVSPDTVEIAGKSGETARLAIDPATHLPAKIIYREEQQSGPATVEETYSDWRDVNGIKVPFHLTITQDGKPFGDATVDDYRINTGVTVEDLSKKP